MAVVGTPGTRSLLSLLCPPQHVPSLLKHESGRGIVMAPCIPFTFQVVGQRKDGRAKSTNWEAEIESCEVSQYFPYSASIDV